MDFKPCYSFLLVIIIGCTQQKPSFTFNTGLNNPPVAIPQHYTTVEDIPVPPNYQRTTILDDGFTNYLRALPLKENNTVYLYNGEEKVNQSAQFAVVDISVGERDLQQCADAVMRLRAEHLYQQGKFNSIQFTDNEGKYYYFTPPYNRINFQKYLNKVFAMCGSASIEKQMKSISIYEIRPGDVLIRGGFPGHAVIVVDVAINAANEKIFMLAQSYMPAQDIHILKNPNNQQLSPWYKLNNDPIIETPEYSFTSAQLKRW